MEYTFIGYTWNHSPGGVRVAAAVIVDREQQSIVIERDIIAYHISHHIVALFDSGDNSGSRRSNAAGDSGDDGGDYCLVFVHYDRIQQKLF